MPREADALLRRMAEQLGKAGIATSMLDARLIVKGVTGFSDADMIARSDALVSDEDIKQIETLVQRRLAGEPVSRLFERKEFYGRDFKVTSATLDPRPDTEVLVETVLKLKPDGEQMRVLDIGTGTGAIIITLLYERTGWTGVACDVSQDALAVAGENAMTHHVNDRLQLIRSNWFDDIDGSFDLMVSNPPYIVADDIAGLEREVREHDPLIALDGGKDGLDAYRAIFSRAGDYLALDGYIIVEFGAGQEDMVAAIAAENGFQHPSTGLGLVSDLAGIPRCGAFCRS